MFRQLVANDDELKVRIDILLGEFSLERGKRLDDSHDVFVRADPAGVKQKSTGAAKINKEHEPVRSPAVEPRCAPPNILSAYRKEAPRLTESCSARRRSRAPSAPGPAADTRSRDRDGPARARYCACTCPRRTHSSGECR